MLSGLLKNEVAIKLHDRFIIIDNKEIIISLDKLRTRATVYYIIK